MYEDGPATDDEEDLSPSKRVKTKAEEKIKREGLGNDQSAPRFKIEDMAGHNVIDLEHDE